MRQERNRIRIGAKANPRSNIVCIDATLSRRERQIMHVLYKRGPVSGHEIQQSLADSSSYSTVQTILRVLERKGCVRHTEKDLRYVYAAVVPHDVAVNRALKALIETFFEGSPKQAIVALLNAKMFQLDHNEVDEMLQVLQERRSIYL